MKKLFFITISAVIVTSVCSAQITAPVRQNTTIKKVPPPPAPVNKTSTTETQTIPKYTLTSVRVIVRTGNDNKEFPSKVHVTLMATSTPSNWRTYIQTNLGNEMRVNSDTEFGMSVEGPTTALETFQTSGLKLRLSYEPNFFADAWKIESIKLILEFKDQFGNLHPSLGNKTITFSNAYGFLNNEYRYMVCVADASFVPLTAAISKTY